MKIKLNLEDLIENSSEINSFLNDNELGQLYGGAVYSNNFPYEQAPPYSKSTYVNIPYFNNAYINSYPNLVYINLSRP